MKLLLFSLATITITLFYSCSNDLNSSENKPDEPDESNQNPTAQDSFAEIKNEASNLENIYSFLVIKDEEIIIEEYYNDADAQSLLHIRSITKSISSILVGIALGDEVIPSLEEKLVDYFPDYVERNRDDLIDRITLDHLIDMESGFDWDERNEAIAWYTTVSDTWGYFFQKEVSIEPGATFNYNSGAVSLLSKFIEQNQNLSYHQYAYANLFEPLGINNIEWEVDGLGNTRADAGLQLCARDLAKIGCLMIRSGFLDNTQIIPEQWVEDSWKYEIDLNSNYGPIEKLHYNNLWWMGEYKREKIFFGLGYGGQLLICVPEMNIVIVTNHEFRLPGNVVRNHSGDFLEKVFKPFMEIVLNP